MMGCYTRTMSEPDLSWRQGALVRFDELMHAQGPQLAELRAAGVSERRIEALYPFDFENYRDATLRLFASGNRAHMEATNLSMFDIYERVGDRLPVALALSAQNLRTHKHTDWTRNAQTIRRALFANLFMLPLTLRLLESYPYAEDEAWTWSLDAVRLNQDLPQFKDTAQRWLALIEGSSS